MSRGARSIPVWLLLQEFVRLWWPCTWSPWVTYLLSFPASVSLALSHRHHVLCWFYLCFWCATGICLSRLCVECHKSLRFAVRHFWSLALLLLMLFLLVSLLIDRKDYCIWLPHVLVLILASLAVLIDRADTAHSILFHFHLTFLWEIIFAALVRILILLIYLKVELFAICEARCHIALGQIPDWKRVARLHRRLRFAVAWLLSSFNVVLVLADALHAEDIKLLRMKGIGLAELTLPFTTIELGKSKIIWWDKLAWVILRIIWIGLI